MSNLPPGAENDPFAPYNEITREYDVDIEISAKLIADLPETINEDSFKDNLEELVKEKIAEALVDFDIKSFKIWIN